MKQSKDMTLDEIQTKIVTWANEAFPDRTPQQAFLKLYEELGEVLANPRDSLEWADVFIILVDIAHFYGLSGADINQAILQKMSINRQRKWGVNELGLMKHNDSEVKHLPVYHGEGMPSP